MINIQIVVPDFDAQGNRIDQKRYFDESIRALGFVPLEGKETAGMQYSAGYSAAKYEQSKGADTTSVVTVGNGGSAGTGGVSAPVNNPFTEAPAPVPTRERGQPSPGKARRTKAEIAEDEAAQERDNEIADRKAGDAFIVGRGEGAKYGISTGGERINPEDAADEVREVEPGLTLDTVRRAMGALAEKIGMEKAIELQPALIGRPIADLEPDEIPEVLIRLRNAADVADAPVAASAFDDAPRTEPEKPVATKQDVVNAMLRYAKKFDGTQDPAKAVIAGVDCGKVFQMATGDDAINKLSLLPEAFYAKAIEGIDKALEINHFGRTAK